MQIAGPFLSRVRVGGLWWPLASCLHFYSVISCMQRNTCNFSIHSSHKVVSLYMKGCICYFTKWKIHPFISDGTKFSEHVESCSEKIKQSQVQNVRFNEVIKQLRALWSTWYQTAIKKNNSDSVCFKKLPLTLPWTFKWTQSGSKKIINSVLNDSNWQINDFTNIHHLLPFKNIAIRMLPNASRVAFLYSRAKYREEFNI